MNSQDGFTFYKRNRIAAVDWHIEEKETCFFCLIFFFNLPGSRTFSRYNRIKLLAFEKRTTANEKKKIL